MSCSKCTPYVFRSPKITDLYKVYFSPPYIPGRLGRYILCV